MKNTFSLLRSKGVKVLAASAATVASMSAAVSHAIDNTAITAAQTDGAASVELTTTGMIQIVALIVGVGLVISLLKKV